MTSSPTNADRRTLLLFLGFVTLVGLIAWPSFVGRMQYARTRAELAAIRDSAAQAELKSVGKMFTTLARIIGPTVVHVTSKKRLTSVADESAALRGLWPSGGRNDGSGVIVERDGVIVTNYHVVANSSEVYVTLADDQKFTATRVGADPGTDLAVLRIDAKDLPFATWGDSDTVEPGEMVWAIGNPFGLDRTITYGIVSAVGRKGVLESPYQEFLQTDAAINPGSSGGPLVDVHGRVMGITTAIVGKDYSGIGFAIPSNTARKVCRVLLEDGYVERGHVGMLLTSSPPDVFGVLVVAVEPTSPAALAGIRPGDLVVSFDGVPVAEPAGLFLHVMRTPIGEKVPLGLVRDGKEDTVIVQVGRRPQ
jgi:S1-C subfamily serine protease